MVGSNIRRAREAAGVTQVQMADALCVTQAYICAIEKGVKRASVEQVAEISRICRCTTDALIFGETA